MSANVLAFQRTGYTTDELCEADIQVPPGLLGKGQLTLQTISVLAGNPGIGKTWLALALCDAAARGGTWAGLPVKQVEPLYVSAEMTAGQMKGRILKMARGPVPFQMEFQHELNLQDSRGMERLWSTAAKYRPKLMVIDNLRDVYRGPENNNDFVSAIFHTLIEKIAIRFDCCILVIDHHGKPSEFKGGAQAIRGAYVKVATAADVILAVAGPEGEKPRIIFDKCRFAAEPDPVEYELVERPDGKIEVAFDAGEYPASWDEDEREPA